MDLLEIKKAGIPRKKRKRVGRGCGSGHGGTSCKGNKGQLSRSGCKVSGSFDGSAMALFRRTPKRGFHNDEFRGVWLQVSIDQLNVMEEGSEVNLQTLSYSGMLQVPKSKKCRVKLLGTGKLEVKNLKITVDKITQSAREQVEQANGTVEIVKVKRFRRSRRKSS